MSSETRLFASFKHMMVEREVRDPYLGDAVVVEWEPLGAAGNDVLLRLANGREIWCVSHCLTPIGNLASMPLPDRADVRKAMAVERKKVLESIQKGITTEPWPGAEFGKVIISRALSNAIKECE